MRRENAHEEPTTRSFVDRPLRTTEVKLSDELAARRQRDRVRIEKLKKLATK